MSWRCIDLSQVPATPWRNGGGQTRELIAWPSSDHWRWRISVAEVASSGPFSRFDDVQRWLAILAGAGVRLDFSDRVIELTGHSAPLEFDGADPVACQLLDGPVQDINLMVRGHSAAPVSPGRMLRLRGASHRQVAAGRMIALYAIDTAATVCTNGVAHVVPPATLSWQTVPDTTDILTQVGAAIWMEV